MSDVRCKCAWWCGVDCADKARMESFTSPLPEVKSYPPMPPVKAIQRKIVQIATCFAPYDEHTGPGVQLLEALCNDGTVWSLTKGAWEQLPPIPQSED